MEALGVIVDHYDFMPQEASSLPALRPYQLEGIKRAITAGGRFCLFDSMGLGKSVQALGVVKRLGDQRVLVCCPKHAFSVWRDELEKWWPEAETWTFTGTPTARRNILNEFMEHGGIKCLIANYEQVKNLVGASTPKVLREWDTVIADEAHALSNRASQRFKAVARLKSDHLLLLTGTPMRKSLDEYWCYLHLLHPKGFPSYWNFLRNWFHVQKGPFGIEVIGPRAITQFRGLIGRYSVRRRKEDVLRDLPPKSRQRVLVELSPDARRVYNRLADEMLLEYEEAVQSRNLLAQNMAVLTLRLRQLTVLPSMVGSNAPTDVLNTTMDLAGEVVGEGECVVVFTPFRESAQELARRAEDLVGGVNVHLLIGGTDPIARSMILKGFQNSPGPAVLVSTVQLASSWSATRASTAIFCGYDWAPWMNLQAEDRLHRPGQQSAVTCYYVGAEGTIDERVIDVLESKSRWDALMADPRALLGKGKRKECG